jgi:hypothetical protein
MTKRFRSLVGAAAGAVVALGFSSCAYDPHYGSTSVAATYSSGYGHGYGYGGSGFSTSVFIGTGDPGWGYDPTCYSYYDYRTRRYYDPYLYGYYPVGYRPPVVYGAPHPYGWRPGTRYIRPPSHITNVTISNYQNREYRYRNSNYGWAKQVRPRSETSRQTDYRPSRNTYDRRNSQTNDSRPNTASRPSATYSRDSQSRYQGVPTVRGSTRNDTRTQSNGRLPSRYNTPVTSSQQQARATQRTAQANKNYRPQAQGNPQKGNRPPKEKQSKDDKKNKKGEYDHR